MASREVTVREWTCDACGATTRTEGNGKDMPLGWTDSVTVPYGTDYTKGLELCPRCSSDPESAKRRWNQSFG
jgi:hypothetical protein